MIYRKTFLLVALTLSCLAAAYAADPTGKWTTTSGSVEEAANFSCEEAK